MNKQLELGLTGGAGVELDNKLESIIKKAGLRTEDEELMLLDFQIASAKFRYSDDIRGYISLKHSLMKEYNIASEILFQTYIDTIDKYTFSETGVKK